MSKSRVVCLVDGFNLWHAIRELKRPELKWVCLRDLAMQFIDKPTEDLVEVVYFSAIATWRLGGSQDRHRVYIRALKHRGVHVVLGRFKEKWLHCGLCSRKFLTHEEKETDVNIAAMMINRVLGGHDDRCLLLSGDSDFAAAVRAITSITGKPGTVRAIMPPGRFVSRELQKATGRKNPTKMLEQHLRKAMMPDVVGTDSEGVIERPPKWR